MKHNKKGIFDSAKNIKRVLHSLYGCCILLIVAEFLINRHISHDWEKLPAFYPIYGFVSCVALVILASWIRSFLIRDEDYYNDEGTDEQTITKNKATVGGQEKTSLPHSDDRGGGHVDD